MNIKTKLALLFFTLVFFRTGYSQYAPPVGQAGTSAMYKDSSAFINWVKACTVVRGLQDISTPATGSASVGDGSMATGKAQSNAVVSLGDGGSATCTFFSPIENGPGNDFAVFENGFDNLFLELAFVEVSSDGINFVRFRAHSLTSTTVQTGSFDPTDATKINNLAGKYKGGYGTPFDLQELAGSANLDINAVTQVRVIDVVGSINNLYATYDGFGNKVNDPWPTAFPSGGFDLDAIGVIHEKINVGIEEKQVSRFVSVYPNPVKVGESVELSIPKSIEQVELFDLSGKLLLSPTGHSMSTGGLSQGVYIIKMTGPASVFYKKLVVE